PTAGDLGVEGLEAEEALALAGALLPVPENLNCARPLQIRALPDFDVAGGPSLRVAGLWHASVVEGPGRRSVLACQGCNLGCRGCFVPLTHALDSGRSCRWTRSSSSCSIRPENLVTVSLF